MKYELKMETVTPLFIGGSNPHEQPELRAASFRGALRFWFRALLGGVFGDNPIEIFKQESQVFGSTDHASPVVVRIERSTLSSNAYTTYTQLTQNCPGIAYLFFSARSTKKNELERKAIASGCKFVCMIRLRAGIQDLKSLQAAAASFWLLTHLGGLGMRARRGGGCLQITSTDWHDPSLPPLIVHAQTVTQLQKVLQDGLYRLREWAAETFNGSLSPTFQAQPTFDVLHPDWCSIAVVNREFANWSDALNKFGQAMQQFRKRYRPDYDYVKAVLKGDNQLPPIQRAAFGLPLVFYFRSLEKSGILEGKEHDRRASPLLVRVTKLASGKCALVLIRFRSLLLPVDEQLQLRYREHNKEQKVYADQPSDDLLDDFLRYLSQRVAPLLEVRSW